MNEKITRGHSMSASALPQSDQTYIIRPFLLKKLSQRYYCQLKRHNDRYTQLRGKSCMPLITGELCL